MSHNLLLCLLGSAFLFSCEDPRRNLSQAEIERLVEDGNDLMRGREQRHADDIPESEWPESIKALDPVKVIYLQTIGVLVLTYKLRDVERGYLIKEPGQKLTSDEITRYKKIAKNFYYYQADS